MKLSIISNIASDTIITNDGTSIKSVGGPPCYCGLTAREFDFDVILISNYGSDLDKTILEYLTKKGLKLKFENPSHLPTTRFILKINEPLRELILESKCDQIKIDDIKEIRSDAWIVSPILDEVSCDVLDYLVNNKNYDFLLVDPQGFTRLYDSNGLISIKKTLDFEFKNIDALKVDCQELLSLNNGNNDIKNLKILKDRLNIGYMLFSENRVLHMLYKNRHYWYNLPKIDSIDTTGIGDILSATFVCTMIKEHDFLWAFSFSVGSVIAALKEKKRGIHKIPTRRIIEQNAVYVYNGLKYSDL